MRIARWLATWGGCGYFPRAPGTAGSLAGVLAAWVLVSWTGWPAEVLAVAAAVLLGPAVWASGRACQQWGEQDPQRVVVDEVLGQWITLAAAPASDWRYWLLAFAVFRVLDTWKPFPARAAEKLPGGWGVVADDLVAGLYGAIVLVAARRLDF